MKDWDMTHAAAWVGMYQVQIDGITIYRCRVLWDATNVIYASFLPETTWMQLKGHMLGAEKKGDIIEFLCRFRDDRPLVPAGVQLTSRTCIGC